MIARVVLGFVLAGSAGAMLVVTAGACSSSSSGGPAAAPCATLAFTGCPTPPPSWKTDVQPLFEMYCEECHGNGGIAAAQVPLATYEDVFDNRTRAWQQISSCSMPNTDASTPATALPTTAQRQTMVDWLDLCNAPDN